jgi:hypothetical protein
MFRLMINSHHQADKVLKKTCSLHQLNYITLSLYTVHISTYNIIKTYNIKNGVKTVMIAMLYMLC